MQTAALLTEPVPRAILRTAVPSMAAMIASGACTLFDALLLSKGSTALSAAASVSFSLLTLIQTLGFTLGMGAGSFVSRSLGRGDKAAAYDAASTAFFTALLLALGLCVPGLFLAQPLVRLLGAGDSVAAPAAAYARCVLLSAPMLCASLVLSSLLRAQGQTLPNMIAYSLGAAVGIPLQYLLVRVLSLGVRGAGIAMLAREGVTLLALVIAAHQKKRLVHPTLRSFSLRLSVFKDIMRSGLPTLLRQGLMSVSSVLLTRAAASFGDAALAGMGLAVRAAALVSSAVIGFGQGFQPVCGVSFGAGRPDRVKEAYRFCQRWVTRSLCALGVLVFLFARPLLSRFSPGEEALDFAVSVLRAQSAVFFAQGAVIMMNMLTQALGQTVRASIVATSRQGFVFIPLVLLTPRLMGQTGLILCQSASDLLSLLLCSLITRSALTDSSCGRGGYSDARKASR